MKKTSRINESLNDMPVMTRAVEQSSLPIHEQDKYLSLCRKLEDKDCDGNIFRVPMTYVTLGQNIRHNIDTEALDFINLKNSIEHDGLLHPVTVFLENGKPTLKAGFRRFRACEMLGLESIFIMIKTNPNIDSELVQIYENIHRENLDPIDYCQAIEIIRKKEEDIKTIEDLAVKIGLKDRGLVGYYLKAAQWPDDIKALFRSTGLLTKTHIHRIAKLKETSDPIVLRKVIEQYSVNAVREKERREELEKEGESEEKKERQGAEIASETRTKIEALIKARSNIGITARVKFRKLALSYSELNDLERKALRQILAKI